MPLSYQRLNYPFTFVLIYIDDLLQKLGRMSTLKSFRPCFYWDLVLTSEFYSCTERWQSSGFLVLSLLFLKTYCVHYCPAFPAMMCGWNWVILLLNLLYQIPPLSILLDCNRKCSWLSLFSNKYHASSFCILLKPFELQIFYIFSLVHNSIDII